MRMMRRCSMVVAGGALASCAAAPQPVQEIPVRGSTSGFVCRQQSFEAFTGKVATSAVGAELLRASGARVIRWVQPGMMVTMDYREDRVTVHLAENNRIVRASCG